MPDLATMDDAAPVATFRRLCTERRQAGPVRRQVLARLMDLVLDERVRRGDRAHRNERVADTAKAG